MKEEILTQSALSAANLQVITDNVEEGLVLADGQGKLLVFNPAAVKMHSFGSQEEVFKRIGEYPQLFELQYVDGSGVVEFDNWPMIRILKGQKFTDFEVKLIRKDIGKTIIASYSGHPVYEDGKIVMAVMNIRDVTEKKAVEDELRRAIQARDEFLAIASHELKTPLTVMSLQANLQRRILAENEGAPDRKNTEDFIHTIDQIVNRLGRLVEEMLDVSRIQNHKMRLREEQVDLTVIVKNVISQLKSQFQGSGFEAPEFQDGPPVVGYWDALRLGQLVTNLLTNAYRYGKGKPITISLSKMGDEAQLSIKDRGIGIAPEHAERIFQRFERLNEHQETSGLGLGLYISKQIVEAHHGKIWVVSQVGSGSSFIVELPLRRKLLS